MEPTDLAVIDDPAPPRRGSGGRTLLLGIVLALGLGTAAGVSLVSSRDGNGTGRAAPPGLADRPAPDEQTPLPDVTLPAFADGPEIRLADYRGKPLIVNFWATWCAPCVQEMPALQEVERRVGDQVAFLGVNHQDSPVNAEPFVQRLRIEYDLATDPDGTLLYRDLQGFGMPTTLFVDPAGTIVFRKTGPMEADEMLALLEEHLGITP